MVVTGLVKINRLKDCDDSIKGVFNFISEKTNSVGKLDFMQKKTRNYLKH